MNRPCRRCGHSRFDHTHNRGQVGGWPENCGQCQCPMYRRQWLRPGTFRLYVEPRDAWIGVYVAPKAVYVCPLPFVVLRWRRAQNTVAEEKR